MKHFKPKKLIDAAALILDRLDRPASAKEIVDVGRKHDYLRHFFGGKTPHKTLNARLSIDIVQHGSKSNFYRTGPSLYGLRIKLREKSYHSHYRRVYIGNNRHKEVSNDSVAVVERAKLKFLNDDGLYLSDKFPLELLKFLDVKYVDRKHAEKRDDLTQLVSYACICYEHCVLTFEKGKYKSDGGEFEGRQSIGFGGHLSYFDLSLFDQTPGGLRLNILRELQEDLYLFKPELTEKHLNISFAGFLVDKSTKNGRSHLGLAAIVRLDKRLELETPTLGICNLRWLSACSTPNSFDKFEVWSQYLFRHLQDMNER